jgi:sarcosine oxidase subunit alpha
MAIAARLSAGGREVEVIDDALARGGGVTALGPAERATFSAIVDAFDALASRGAIRMRSRTTAGGIYGRDVLVVSEDGAEILEPETLVLACGAHDGVLAFEGNDVPGVMSARAGGWLLGRGVLVGERVVVVVAPGGGPFGASYARSVPSDLAQVELVHGEPVATIGTGRVRAIRVRLTATGEERTYEGDVVLVDAPRSPAYELSTQVGAPLEREPRGFVVRPDHGRIGDGVWATGELAGIPLDAAAIADDAARVAARILAVP